MYHWCQEPKCEMFTWKSNPYTSYIIKCWPFKVEYHANENPLKNAKKIAYVGQRVVYPIIKKLNKKNLPLSF